MAAPLISVIIPVYNHYADLFKTLKSLFQQSIYNSQIEVIVVDDGSTDKDTKKDQEILKIALPQVKFFVIPHAGAAAARNFGFKQSSGEYIIFWDADLETNKLFLEKLLTALKTNPSAAFAYSSFYFGWKKFPGQAFDAQKIKSHNYIPMTSLIRRSDFLG
ncbi:MAG: glycosyltransferase family 2 protein, partial [Candidatus Magasanikbacteria bacterium]|nr:glycosyltransferase family 2 protein [Candidatus Magasanikbacteria bacterium]